MFIQEDDAAADPDDDTVLEFELLSVHAGGVDQDDALLATFFAVDNATGTITLTDAGAENLDYERIFESMQKPAFIFDGRNILNIEKLQKIGFHCWAVGKSLTPTIS